LKTSTALRPGPGLETFPQARSGKIAAAGKWPLERFFHQSAVAELTTVFVQQAGGLKKSERGRAGKSGGGAGNISG
jgi:hypothetical protein